MGESMRARRQAFGLLAAAALVVAACGSDDDETGTTGASTPATAPSSSAATADTAADTTAATGDTAADTTTGDTAATDDLFAQAEVQFSDEDQYRADVDRTGETIKIGVTNDEGPAFSTPEMRPGILTAIDFINANGGVNGAILEPVVCVGDATPEGAINCANEFVEADVNLVTYGTNVSIDAALPIFEEAGIAIVSDYAYNQTPSENVWALSAPLSAYALGPLPALKELGLTKVAYLPLDTPFHRFQGTLSEAWGEVVGVEVVVGAPVDGGTGDWTSAIQTVLDEGAEALISHPPTNHIQSIITTARQLGFDGPILTTDTQFIEQVGVPDVLNTYTMSPRFQSLAAAESSDAPQRIQDNLALYEQVMTDAGHADIIESYAENQFASTVDIATILEMIPEGPIDLDSIRAVLSEDRWVIGFDAPDFNCGAAVWPADPSFCRGFQAILEVVEQDGELVQVPLKEDNFGFYFFPKLNEQSTTLLD